MQMKADNNKPPATDYTLFSKKLYEKFNEFKGDQILLSNQNINSFLKKNANNSKGEQIS